MSTPLQLTVAQVSALTALAVADGDDYLLGLLDSATWRSGASIHIRTESYAARRLAEIAAEMEAL